MVRDMFNFFAENNSRIENTYKISGTDYNHIKNVLRMHEGERILISDDGTSHLGEISQIDDETIYVSIIEENYNNTELPVKIYLYQGLPKSDKMELIIQKTVELGVYEIIPVEMSRCVVKLEDKKKKNKVERWQAIAESAAKQSKRNIIPEISSVLSYSDALKKSQQHDLVLIPYESHDGMANTVNALKNLKSGQSVGIFIGPEGGFDEKEIEKACAFGGQIISLGKRILRTETAAVTSVGMCMLHAEILGNGE